MAFLRPPRMPKEPKKRPEEERKVEEQATASAAKKKTSYPYNLRDKSRDTPTTDYLLSFVCLLLIVLVGIPNLVAAIAGEQSNQSNDGGVIVESLQKTTLPEVSTMTPTPTATPTPTVTREEELEKDMVELVNYQRELNNLQPLEVDPVLTKVAIYRSEDMAKNNYFSHNPPNGCPSFCLLDYAQYLGGWEGENLAMNNYINAETIEAAMDDLMKSDGHREIILGCHYEKLGIGVAKVGDKYYYTQVFAGNIDC